MMIHKPNQLTIFVIFFLMISSLISFSKEYLNLNLNSLYVIKNLNNKNPFFENNSNLNLINKNVICHSNWINLLPKILHVEVSQYISSIEETIECSIYPTYFISKYFPDNTDLAALALDYYPNNSKFLLWFGDTIIFENPNYAEEVYLKVVIIDQTIGRAWHQLAFLTERKGNIENALNYYKKSCFYGAIGNHDCYYSARLLESIGKYDEALYYYQISSGELAKKQVDRLKLQLNLEDN